MNFSYFQFLIFDFINFQSHDEFDTIVLLVSIFYGFFTFLLLFVTCEVGEQCGKIFSEIDDEVVQLDWYLFSLEVQKLLPIVMINTQEPVVIKCFGSVAWTRE